MTLRSRSLRALALLATVLAIAPASARRAGPPADPASASLAAGFAHSLALAADGTLWSWGDNSSGQLGDGTRTTRDDPTRVASFQSTPVAVAAGGAHSLALGSDGRVRAWGLNEDGQLGDGTTTRRLVPTPVAGLTGAVAIAAGTRHSLALKSDGTLVAWGANDSGQLGDGTRNRRTTPVAVSTLTGVVAMAAGLGHTLAVRSDGTLWAWGDNTSGQLGDGTHEQRKRPVRVTTAEPIGAAIAAGAMHSLASGVSGAVYAFGSNVAGQLGDGTFKTRLRPVRVRDLTGVASLSAGLFHSLGATHAGGLRVWGALITVPRAVAPPTGVVSVAAGSAHNLALATDGAIWTQGINLTGALGDGTHTSRAEFMPISGPNQTWGVYPPVFSPGAGTYSAPQAVIVSTPTPGATIHYTTNGLDPTNADPQVASGASLPIDRTTQLKARAFRTGLAPSGVTDAVYAFVVANPVATPAGGLFTTTPQHVTLATATPGATITYTLDGSDPSELSTPYAAPVPVPSSLTLRARAFRAGWNASAIVSVTFAFNLGTLATPVATPAGGTFSAPATVTLVADAGATIRYTLDGTDPTPASPAFGSPLAIAATATLKAQAYRHDWTPSAVLTEHYVIETGIPPGEEPPPDPATVAPPLQEDIPTSFADAMSFLYSGPNPIQRGVEPDAIEDYRVGVIRGRVLTRDGEPLVGTRIAVAGASALGYAVSRPDGVFDLAVNGGGAVVLEYTRDGFLPAQRRLDVPWQEYVFAEDVRLARLDPRVTVIDFSETETAQVAQGSVSTDSEGSRQATVIVPEGGVLATMTLPDGEIVPALSQLSIRATEYTVGSGGPETMPGALPTTSGYTYAVELSADEAIQAGATMVNFDRPLAFYVENFLGFDVGGIVPAGYYDRREQRWIASDNGRVVAVLAVDGDGLAELDIDGFGAPADPDQLSALGVTEGERRRLGGLYQPGQELWRVPITHFTPWDANWPYGPPPNARPPQLPSPPNGSTRSEGDKGLRKGPTADVEDPCKAGGSIVECQNQSLGESLPIAGTPFSLSYRSDRAIGPASSRTFGIPVSGASLPEGLKRIEVDVTVAGQQQTRSFEPAPNQSTSYAWDGRDIFGRTMTGVETAHVNIRYIYGAVYYEPADFAQSFASIGSSVPLPNRARGEISLRQEMQFTVDARRRGQTPLAGWNLDVHHRYDPKSQTLYLGTGTQRTAASVGDVIGTIAGGGTTPVDDAPVPADQVEVDQVVYSLAVAADGSVFFVDTRGILVRTRDDRVRRLVPPEPPVEPFGSDDWNPSLAAAPGGGIYFSKGIIQGHCAEGGRFTGMRIRHLSASGAIRPVATVQFPQSLSCSNWQRIAVGKDGTIYLVVGTGLYRIEPGSASQPASAVPIGTFERAIYSLATGPDGRIYAGTQGAIYQWLNGQITTIAGKEWGGHSGDGGPAVDAEVEFVWGMFVEPTGNLVFTQHWPVSPHGNDARIRVIRTDGTIFTYAGGGPLHFTDQYWTKPEGSLGSGVNLHSPYGIARSPEGDVYFGDNAFDGARVRRLLPALPRSPFNSAFQVPSEDGGLLYEFDKDGIHLRTVDTLTGVVLNEFSYDGTRLAGIRDRNGLLTTISRNGADPTAIVGPFGVTTQLGVSGGYLTSVTDPEGNETALGYGDGGLLTSLRDANGNTHVFEYDGQGRLIRDSDPAGGTQTLARTESPDGWTATRSLSDVGTFSYVTEQLPAGGHRRIAISPDGTQTIAESVGDGQTKLTAPDGTRTVSTHSPDPRFRFGAPIASSAVITTPGGLEMTLSKARTVVLNDPHNPLSVASLTETTRMNGRTSTSVFNAAARTITSTTPANRRTLTTLDARGRPISVQIGTQTPTTFQYDAQGRVIVRAHGTRETSFTYDAHGYVASVTDPMARTVQYTSDKLGRKLEQVFPDGRTAAFAYDGNGNLTSITPPDRTAHQLTYTSVDRLESYSAPAAAGGSPVTSYSFNLAAQPTRVTRADGQELQWIYDGAGRVETLTTPAGNTTYSYSPSTGQMLSITSPDSSSLAFTYEGPLPKAETWAGAVSGTVDVTFDNNFRVTSERVRGASEVAFQYDADGLLTRAGSLNLARHPANGYVTSAVLGGITSTFSYNGFGEIVSEETRAGGTVLFSVAYTRNAAGRLLQKTETIEGLASTEDYVYDTAGRLTAVTSTSGMVRQYGYDANGNRTLVDYGYGPFAATYDAQDRLLTFGEWNYAHTAHGEVSGWGDPASGLNCTFRYDTQGNLLEVILPSSARVQYVADAKNRRVATKIDGTVVQGFLYQGQLRPVAELDGAGVLVSRFVYGARAAAPEYMVKGSQTYRFVTDQLGSVRLVIDTATNAVVQRLDYDPFGLVVVDTNPGFQPFGYAGGLYDPYTGLVRFGVRDYDPLIGRWLSKDPIGFRGGDSNLYAYVGNDPINSVDPTGLFVWDIIDLYFFGQDVVAFVRCPGMGTGVMVLIGAAGALPGIPSLGWLDDVGKGLFQRRAVIGKMDDIGAERLAAGEHTLLKHLEGDLGSARANWERNSSVLRTEMAKGQPIRDASVDGVTGELIKDTGFLRAERDVLRNRGWTYDPGTSLWVPPGK